MGLPLLELGALAVKTLSKPVADQLKKQAGLHPRFRQIIIDIAQANHRMTTKMQRIIYSHATDVEIRPLNEEKAVEDGVDFIREVFLFSLGVAGVLFKVQRSARKEELRRQEIEVLRERNEHLSKEIEILRHKEIEILRHKLEELLLRHKLEELEQLAKGRGLGGIFNFKHGYTKNANLVKPS